MLSSVLAAVSVARFTLGLGLGLGLALVAYTTLFTSSIFTSNYLHTSFLVHTVIPPPLTSTGISDEVMSFSWLFLVIYITTLLRTTDFLYLEHRRLRWSLSCFARRFLLEIWHDLPQTLEQYKHLTEDIVIYVIFITYASLIDFCVSLKWLL